MKKIIIISLSCILLLCGCTNKQKTEYSNSNNKQLEKEITENFFKIMEVSDLKSSNPYDYTKNEYYNNLVALGANALPVLENMFNTGKLIGVEAYISAQAIQDITKCNLHNEYNLDWATAEEFYEF